MTAEGVVTRWTQDNSVARRSGTTPFGRSTPIEDRRILRLSLTNVRMTKAEMGKRLQAECHHEPSGTDYWKLSWDLEFAILCLLLTPYHRQQRLAWCRARVNYNIECHSVMFSDESHFCFWQWDRRQRVHRRPGERSQEAAIIEAHTSPTPGIMVWRAIGYGNRTDLALAEGRLNARQYVARMVNPVTIPFMTRVPNDIMQDPALQFIPETPWRMYESFTGQLSTQMCRP